MSETLHITPAELVERWKGKVALQTLAHWRNKRQGPPYVKFGRTVLYPLDKLEAWEAEQMVETNAR